MKASQIKTSELTSVEIEKVSTRCHPFCPQEVTYYVHEMSATHILVTLNTTLKRVSFHRAAAMQTFARVKKKMTILR